jgi:predicted metal-dependent phosphotriesterase family hydrolase
MSMISRRSFLQKSLIAGAGTLMLPYLAVGASEAPFMTVLGPIETDQMGFTLTHEHVLADFIGAAGYSKSRYNVDEVYKISLPFLKDLKKQGCETFIDCSPAYLGRDVLLLKRLATSSGLNIITNTGYYGAVNEKFLPPHAFTESAEQIADRWIKEWRDGIEGTGIKPGFIKTSVDKAPLTTAQTKIIEAAALTHLSTGLTIAIHTGDGEAAREQLRILNKHGVNPSARIWVHAQNEENRSYHLEAAKLNGWVSFDGVNPETVEANVGYLQTMKDENMLHRVLVSQDSGWYNVGEPNV